MKPRYRPMLFPTGGWEVSLPDGSIAKGFDLDSLIRAVAEVRGFTPESAEDFVHDRLCAKFPNYCERGRTVDLGGLTPAARASIFLTSIQASAAKVSEETKEARLLTCSVCPQNGGLSTPGCCGNKKTNELLATSVGAKCGVKQVFASGWCAITGRNLAIAASLDLPPIPESDPVHTSLPEACPYRAS